jgi:hypothetical protein
MNSRNAVAFTGTDSELSAEDHVDSGEQKLKLRRGELAGPLV